MITAYKNGFVDFYKSQDKICRKTKETILNRERDLIWII